MFYAASDRSKSRREYFMHQQSELLTHIQNTNSQYNLPAFPKRIGRSGNREGIAERFDARRFFGDSVRE